MADRNFFCHPSLLTYILFSRTLPPPFYNYASYYLCILLLMQSTYELQTSDFLELSCHIPSIFKLCLPLNESCSQISNTSHYESKTVFKICFSPEGYLHQQSGISEPKNGSLAWGFILGSILRLLETFQ